MSDNQQPADWWVASDGRWYPRELHPSVLRPEVPPLPADDPRPEEAPARRTRSRSRSRILGAVAAAAVLVVGALVVVGSSGGGKGAHAASSATTTPRGRAGTATTASPATAGSSGTVSGSASSPSASSSHPAGSASTPVTGAGPGAGSASEVDAGQAGNDVAVTQCVVDPTSAHYAVVNGTVVNHDVQTDDYTVTVDIFEGGERVGSAFATDDAVAVDATSPWSVLGAVAAGTGGDLTCQVASVERVPS